MSEKAERYIGTILENIEGTLKLILERLDFSDDKTKTLGTRINRIEGRLDEVELKLMDGE